MVCIFFLDEKINVSIFFEHSNRIFFSSENYQDFICLISCSFFIFILAYVFCKLVDSYLQRRQYQHIANEIDRLLLSDRFLTVIKNGLQDNVCNKQLHTDSTKKYNQQRGRFDLDDRLNQMKFNEIIENSDSYFKNVKLTNFDLIHNECNGSELSYIRGYYQTLFKENLDSEITDQKQKNSFISSAIKCHRDDFLIEKKIIDEHFIQKLEKKYFFIQY